MDLEAEGAARHGAQLGDDRAVERDAAAAALALGRRPDGARGRPGGGAAGAVGVADEAGLLERGEVAVDRGDVAGAGGRELLGSAGRARGVEALEQPPARGGEAEAAGAQGAEGGGERRRGERRRAVGYGHAGGPSWAARLPRRSDLRIRAQRAGRITGLTAGRTPAGWAWVGPAAAHCDVDMTIHVNVA